MDYTTVAAIWHDWRDGMTHGEIVAKHNVSRAQEYAITYACDHISKDAMTCAERVARVTPGMNAAQIQSIMAAN